LQERVDPRPEIEVLLPLVEPGRSADQVRGVRHDVQQAVYTLNQFHSYDWLVWNPAFAAVLLATGFGLRGRGVLPTPVVWATIVIGASLITPLGFFGFILLPVWLIVVGLLLFRSTTASAEPIRS